MVMPLVPFEPPPPPPGDEGAARPASTESRRPWWYPPSWVEDVDAWLRACREVGAVAGLDVPERFVPKPDPPPCIGFHR